MYENNRSLVFNSVTFVISIIVWDMDGFEVRTTRGEHDSQALSRTTIDAVQVKPSPTRY